MTFLTRPFAWTVCFLITTSAAFTSRADNEDRGTSGSGLDVAIVLHTAQTPAVGQRFIGQIKNHVQLSLGTMLGNGAKVGFPEVPPMNDWLRQNNLSSLSPELCVKLGCNTSDKTIVVQVAYSRGSFQLSATEFDRFFNHVGPVHHVTILQREMVPDAAARLALKCWTPVGRIDSKRGEREFIVVFTNHARLSKVPNWSQLTRGKLIQLYRHSEFLSSDQPQRHPTMFFEIKEVSATSVISGPLQDPWDKRWLQSLNDPRFDYLVRRVTPIPGRSTIQVSIRGKIETDPSFLVPRGGCDVYLHEMPSAGMLLADDIVAVTDRNGVADIEVSQEKPVFVTVLYGDQTISHSFVRGVTPEPLRFEFEYMGNQTDYLNSLKWVEDKLRINQAIINDRVTTVNETAKQGDQKAIEEIADEVMEYTDIEFLLQRIESIARTATEEGIDIVADVKRTRELAKELQRGNAELRTQMDQAVQFADAEGRLEKIQDLFNAGKWDDTLSEWEQFAKDFPAHEQTKKLAAFRATAQPKDESHRKARQLLAAARSIDNLRDLADQWDAIRDSIDLLISNNDLLHLLDLQSALHDWRSVLQAATTTLVEDNKKAKSLTKQADLDAARKDLEERQNAIKGINTDLKNRSQTINDRAQRAKSLL